MVENNGLTPAIRKEHSDKKSDKVFTTEDFKLYECPITYVKESTHDLMSLLFRVDSLGVLPSAGGWLDQLQSFIQAWDVMKSEEARYIDSLKKKT